MESSCRTRDSALAISLESLFDQYPSQLQKMFCGLKAIRTTVGAGPLVTGRLIPDPRRPGRSLGAELVLRADLASAPADGEVFMSWQEQFLFGGSLSTLQINQNLPSLRLSPPGAALSALFLPVATQFARWLDVENQFNRWVSCAQGQTCSPVASSWGAISWLGPQQPKAKNDFALRKQLCFDGCPELVWQSSQVDGAYQELLSTDFINLQASASPAEDFAQTMAIYTLWMQARVGFVLRTVSGLEVDLGARLKQKPLVQKFATIERILRSPLKYPGQD